MPSVSGIAGALGLAICGLQVEGVDAWMEDSASNHSCRTQLGWHDCDGNSIHADRHDSDAGSRIAASADWAVVTSRVSRHGSGRRCRPRQFALLPWARRYDACIIGRLLTNAVQSKRGRLRRLHRLIRTNGCCTSVISAKTSARI
jgi:hypothetical protein